MHCGLAPACIDFFQVRSLRCFVCLDYTRILRLFVGQNNYIVGRALGVLEELTPSQPSGIVAIRCRRCGNTNQVDRDLGSRLDIARFHSQYGERNRNNRLHLAIYNLQYRIQGLSLAASSHRCMVAIQREVEALRCAGNCIAEFHVELDSVAFPAIVISLRICIRRFYCQIQVLGIPLQVDVHVAVFRRQASAVRMKLRVVGILIYMHCGLAPACIDFFQVRSLLRVLCLNYSGVGENHVCLRIDRPECQRCS